MPIFNACLTCISSSIMYRGSSKRLVRVCKPLCRAPPSMQQMLIDGKNQYGKSHTPHIDGKEVCFCFCFCVFWFCGFLVLGFVLGFGVFFLPSDYSIALSSKSNLKKEKTTLLCHVSGKKLSTGLIKQLTICLHPQI